MDLPDRFKQYKHLFCFNTIHSTVAMTNSVPDNKTSFIPGIQSWKESSHRNWRNKPHGGTYLSLAKISKRSNTGKDMSACYLDEVNNMFWLLSTFFISLTSTPLTEHQTFHSSYCSTLKSPSLTRDLARFVPRPHLSASEWTWKSLFSCLHPVQTINRRVQ